MARSFIDRIDAIDPHTKGTYSAPHKPLYLLYLLSQVQKREERLIHIDDIEVPLKSALQNFGGKKDTFQYPFWRLQNSDLAEVSPNGAEAYQLRQGSKDPNLSSMRENNAHGGLLAEDFEELKLDNRLHAQAVHRILDTFFPTSIHEDIIHHFEIELDHPRRQNQSTSDAEFRDRVLVAYSHRCAISGFYAEPLENTAGLEAADVIWRSSFGPGDVTNGIAMSSLHRRLFHLGYFTVDGEYQIQVADELGERGARIGLEARNPLRVIPPEDSLPCLDSLQWHWNNVFRGALS